MEKVCTTCHSRAPKPRYKSHGLACVVWVRRRTNSFPLGKSRNVSTRVWTLVPPSSGSFLPMPASFLQRDEGIYEHRYAQLPNNYIATQNNAVQVSGGREQDKEKQTSMKPVVVMSIFLKEKNTLCNFHFWCGRRKNIKKNTRAWAQPAWKPVLIAWELVFSLQKKNSLTKDRWPEAHPERVSPCIFFQSHNSTLDRQSPVARHLLGL